MGLLYENKGRLALSTRRLSLTLPACSLLDVPYGHGFDEDPCMAINDGDLVRFSDGDRIHQVLGECENMRVLVTGERAFLVPVWSKHLVE